MLKDHIRRQRVTSVVFISRNKLIALRLTAREFKSRRRVRIGGEKVLKSNVGLRLLNIPATI